MDTLIGVFLVGVTVFIHELGHYLAGISQGIYGEIFSIGFGPRLIKLGVWRGTEFRISMIPLGGYVKFPDQFMETSPKGKWKVLAAGPMTNAVFAGIFLFVYILQTKTVENMLGILILFFLAELISIGGTLLLVPVTLVLLTGIFGFDGVGGPVSAVVGASDAFHKGSEIYLYICILNVSLGSMNLLPIIPLDGGHLIEMLFQKITSKTGKFFVKCFKAVGITLLINIIIRAYGGDISMLLGK